DVLHPLSLHDALPISLGLGARRGSGGRVGGALQQARSRVSVGWQVALAGSESARLARSLPGRWQPRETSHSTKERSAAICGWSRSEEHTSELQSRGHL